MAGPNHRLLEANVQVGAVVVDAHLAEVGSFAADGGDRFANQVERLARNIFALIFDLG